MSFAHQNILIIINKLEIPKAFLSLLLPLAEHVTRGRPGHNHPPRDIVVVVVRLFTLTVVVAAATTAPARVGPLSHVLRRRPLVMMHWRDRRGRGGAMRGLLGVLGGSHVGRYSTCTVH